ncbi:MAG: hypothetical protein IPO73_13350 [Gemmatimonadetes bacterium]|nr:hypothetical protein [Gemmatimonadota bacterium]
MSSRCQSRNRAGLPPIMLPARASRSITTAAWSGIGSGRSSTAWTML